MFAKRAAFAAIASITAVAFGCGGDAWIELQIADDRLPFLIEGIDFDGLGVEAKSASCASTVVEYPARPLPATLTVLPGSCFVRDVSLQAFAQLGDRRIAQSSWLDLAFPSEGALVATATLAELPGPRVRFRAGFEPGEPEMIFVVRQRDINMLTADLDTTVFEQGTRSLHVKGTATSTNSHAIVRAAATNLVIDEGDRLVYALRVEPGTAPPTVGVDLQLDSAATAKSLGLTDVTGIPVHPGSSQGRDPNLWLRFVVDLTPAANTRLVGILFGFDARDGGGPGTFDTHLDDVLIEVP